MSTDAIRTVRTTGAGRRVPSRQAASTPPAAPSTPSPAAGAVPVGGAYGGRSARSAQGAGAGPTGTRIQPPVDAASGAPPRSFAPRAGATVPGSAVPGATAPGTAAPAAVPAASLATGAGAVPLRTGAAASGKRGGTDLPGRRTTAPTRPGAPGAPTRRKFRRRRAVAAATALVLVFLIAWPLGLLFWANGKISRVDALSGAAGTPGTTYLLAGSDARGDGISEDGTEGARTDTIMILHKPRNGPVALISIPRDSYTPIPGHGSNKLNAAYSFGGAPLLVTTVEKLTGLTVDHYVEVGFGGVEGIVNALGGVELCYDANVNDPRSELVWTSGCHKADGHTALAFSRMRYSDPKGDIGRAERQRQVIGAIGTKAANPAILFQPTKQVSLLKAGVGALQVDQKTGIIDLGRLALDFRKATGPDGVTGTPPIAKTNYRPGAVGSAVLLDPDKGPQFWQDIRDGKLPPGAVGGTP